jgi:LysM repeat protein
MRKLIPILFLLLIGTVMVVQAQGDNCPETVEQALDSVGTLCNPLDRNSICYGSSVVKSTTVLQPPPQDFFNAPGDRAELVAFREINPQPFDPIDQTFGVAVMNVQADVPNTLPGQAVLFMLMGDARLTNEVPQNASEQSAFQSFYFLPGINRLNCYEADPILTIQTPGNITVTIALNGVDTEMSPGTLLTITPSVCTIHRGNIIQRVGETTASLLANQTVDIHIEASGSVVVDNLRNISQREYERGLAIQDAVNTLAKANGWQEQFITEPRQFDEEPASNLVSVPAATADPGDCDVQHIVVSGETLHRIAQTYDTGVQAIADANGLSDPRLIYTGQALCIPGMGSGFVPLPSGGGG